MRTILVHGYNFDPGSGGRDDPYETVFREWRAQLPDAEAAEFGYYSAGGSRWRTVPRAWAAGYRNTYRWAYSELATAASDRLVQWSAELGPCNVVCHSLGTRVVLLAAARGAQFDRVLLLSGAEMASIARGAALRDVGTQYLNVLSRTDAVIDLLAENFTPGGGGAAIGHDGVVGLPNWRNAVLDHPDVIDWGLQRRGWDLRGDNPDELADHHVSFRWPGNWDLYRAFISGDDLDDMPDRATGSHD